MAEKEKSGISRRDLFKASGAAAIGAIAAGSMFGMTGCASSEVQKASGHIAANTLKCSGCKTCMIVCSLKHGNECGPSRARLKVVQATIDLFNTNIYTCKQCATPMCMYACDVKGVGAISVDPDTGARVINADKCTGCQACIEACPQYPNSPIYFNEDTQTCFKCDLCGGDPQCVKYCPMSATWSEHCYPLDEHPLRFEQE